MHKILWGFWATNDILTLSQDLFLIDKKKEFHQAYFVVPEDLWKKK